MTLSDPEIGAYLAVLARVGGLAATAPVIGDPGVAVRPRLVFVLAVSAAIGANRAPVPLAALPMIAAVELAVGLATGLVARVILSRIAIAGQLMGIALGLGFAAQYDPHAGESAGVLRTLCSTLGSLAFLAAHGLEAIVRSVAQPTSGLGMLGGTTQLLREGTASFGWGLSLAAPIILAAVVGNLGLAVMNRAAPAMNVFSIALSAVLLIGIALLVASAGGFVSGAMAVAHDTVHVLVP